MTAYKKFNDHELTNLLKEKDETAFGEIYNRYWAVLYLHARNMLRNQEEAKDIVQELFVLLWERAAEIDFKSSLSSYLYRAVRNKIFNYFEHKKVVSNYQQSLLNFIEEGRLITDEKLREKELAEIIEMEVLRLPVKMMKVFKLSRNEHLSYYDISEQLGISEHTVKSQISNALRILRVRIGLFSIVISHFIFSFL